MTQSGLRAQPGKPTGIVGRIVGYLMEIYNRHVRMNAEFGKATSISSLANDQANIR